MLRDTLPNFLWSMPAATRIIIGGQQIWECKTDQHSALPLTASPVINPSWLLLIKAYPRTVSWMQRLRTITCLRLYSTLWWTGNNISSAETKRPIRDTLRISKSLIPVTKDPGNNTDPGMSDADSIEKSKTICCTIERVSGKMIQWQCLILLLQK